MVNRPEYKHFENAHAVRSVVESAPFPIGVYVGPEMRIVFANNSIKEVWGKGDDVVGRRYSDVLPELVDSGIYEQLDSVFTTGVPFHARNQRVDLMVGSELRKFYFNYSFTPLYDEHGAIYGVMNTAADITDLHLAKQQVEYSERKFHNMILQAPVAMCILMGPNHRIEVANELMIRLWGKNEQDVMGKPVFDALPDARRQGLEKLLDEVYTTGKTFTASERPVELVRNGVPETVYQNFVYEPYRESDGTILGVIAISLDVTSQVLSRRLVEQSEAELLRIKSQLEIELEAGKQVQQLKDDFIGIASHELKTPLTSLKSSLQLLKRMADEEFPDKAKNLINLANTSISKLTHLLEELLNDTRINEGQLELSKRHFLLRDVIEESCQHIRLTGKTPVEIRGDLSLEIYADPHRIEQVVLNLISNAAKYAPKSEKIQVLVERDQETARVSVIDQGDGIAPDKLPHLFKRYYRVDTSGMQYSGLGLGLFICSEIISRHGGQVGVISKQGEGSTFWFTLPLNG